MRFLLACLAVLAITSCSDSSDNVEQQGPFEVSTSEWVFVDKSRGTPATGDFPALPDRTLETLVFLPEGAGKRPLLIFSHGLGATPQFYESLIETVAAAGFVVVAPAFPLTNLNAPAGPDAADTQQQPGDVSFMIDTVSTAVAAGEPPFAGAVDVDAIGTFGHSNGAITTLGIAANSCCVDPRIDAAAAIAGTASPFNDGDYDFGSSAPLLLVHGTLDVLVPFEGSVRVFNEVEAAKGLLTLTDQDHGSFLRPSGHGFDSTSNTIIDFFRTHLREDDAAQQRLEAGEVYDTNVDLLYSTTGGTEVTLPLPPPITNRAAAVEPDTGLVDGQVVTVSWRNFVPGDVISILQCSEGGTGGPAFCEFGNGYLLRDNPTGDGSLPLTIIVGNVGSGVCDASTDDCVIVFNDGSRTNDEANVRIPISFAE